MFSYWEKQSFFRYDVIIIGGGITGISTAISLLQKKPALKIAVLERGIIPAGASTRNAGFACVGSFTEILDDWQHMPENKVLSLIQMRRDGLKLLRKRLGDAPIGYRENGSYELISEHEIPLLNQLDTINEKLKPLFGGEAFSMQNDKITAFGFNTHYVQALIRNHFEGELDTGKMMRALWQLAMQSGIEIKTGCTVESMEDRPDGIAVTVNRAGGEPVVFEADTIAVCTNAFTKALFPDIDLSPGRGQVIITDPVPGLAFKGIFHFDRGYYYFREINGRVLFGGGRNLDFTTETTTEPALNERIQNDLEEKLRTIILPHSEVPIATRWAGIMAFGKNKYPLIRQYSDRIFMGVRLGGMGVAIGSRVGEQLAEMIAG